jgi:hypothetical protein
VDVGEASDNRKHRHDMEKLQMEAIRKDTALFPDYEMLMKIKDPLRVQKIRKREIDKQRKAAEAELRKAGIDLHKGRPKKEKPPKTEE